MKDIYEVCKEVEDYLRDNRLYVDVYPYRSDMPVVDVDIHWGDWKHEHLRAKWLLGEIGLKLIGSTVTEENGSDCYSAVHHFYYEEEVA